MLAAATLSPTEAAALLDLPERQVRKEIEHGVVGAGSPPRLSFPALVYFQVLRRMDLELGVEDRRKVLGKILDAMACSPRPEAIALGSVLSLHLGPVVEELTERLNVFDRWKERLVTSPDILGGEPVFPGSRLAVRHVGGLALRGESPEAIREDYPYLSEEDVVCARLFARAYPRVGRPPTP